jgi:hypothetical protein
MPTIIKKECIKKIDIVSQIHLHVVSFIWRTPIFVEQSYFWAYFIMLSPMEYK